MGADSLAAIAPLVSEVLAGEVALQAAAEQWCGTLEVSGNAQAWVQFTPGTLNFAYPRTSPPEEVLAPILAPLLGWKVESWEPSKYATITFSQREVYAISRVIDCLFEGLLGEPEPSLDTSLIKVSRQ